MGKPDLLVKLAIAAALLCASTPEPLAVQVQNAIDARNKKQEEVTQECIKAKTSEERGKLEMSRFDIDNDCGLKLYKLVCSQPGDQAGETALLWIFHTCKPTMPEFSRALDLYRKHYAASVKIGAACPTLMNYSASKPVIHLMQAVIRKNPSATCRAMATYSLGMLVVDQSPAQARKYFNLTIAKFGHDGEELHNDNLDELAKDGLFSMSHLRIGTPAPDLSGTDSEGKTMHLSDYQGKVVMLVFSGTWCGPCQALYPHERELVDNLPPDNFSLIAINSDARDRIAQFQADKTITWRCVVDQSSEGPIATRWHIKRWPAIYIIDSKGVIRYRPFWTETAKIDAEIDALIKKEKNKGA